MRRLYIQRKKLHKDTLCLAKLKLEQNSFLYTFLLYKTVV